MPLIINNQEVDDAQIRDEFEQLEPYYQQAFPDQSPDEQKAQLLKWSKENVIERILIQQQAKKYDCRINPDEIQSALAEAKKQYTKNRKPESKNIDEQKLEQEIILQLKVKYMLDDVCKDLPEPSERDILDFYNENKQRFMLPERIKVSHIVKHINWQTDEGAARNMIQKTRDELKAGNPFEILVSKYSDCPEDGGNLGYITRGQMVEEFDDVVFNLNVGQVSDIFRTRFGFHIAKLYDRKPQSLIPLEKAQGQIISELKQQAKTKAIENFIDRLKSKAQIKEV
ncbi:peptidylprolyl isomerase [Planctomycetota bacterium]